MKRKEVGVAILLMCTAEQCVSGISHGTHSVRRVALELFTQCMEKCSECVRDGRCGHILARPPTAAVVRCGTAGAARCDAVWLRAVMRDWYNERGEMVAAQSCTVLERGKRSVPRENERFPRRTNVATLISAVRTGQQIAEKNFERPDSNE